MTIFYRRLSKFDYMSPKSLSEQWELARGTTGVDYQVFAGGTTVGRHFAEIGRLQMTHIEVTVNGKQERIEVRPSETVLEMIRERLNLNGTK